jgi:hypothetical protein
VKELDKIKNVGNIDFELFLEGSDLGGIFKNCWSWEIGSFYTWNT